MASYSDIKGLAAALTELVKKGATLEAQQKIVELREILVELKEENIDLRERLGEMERAAKTKESLIFDHGVYWKVEDNQQRNGPYCPPCYDSTGKLIRLKLNSESDIPSYYTCTICNFLSG